MKLTVYECEHRSVIPSPTQHRLTKLNIPTQRFHLILRIFLSQLERSVSKISIHICFPPTTHSSESVCSHTLSDTTKHREKICRQRAKMQVRIRNETRCVMYYCGRVRDVCGGSVGVKKGGENLSSRRDGKSRGEIGVWL